MIPTSACSIAQKPTRLPTQLLSLVRETGVADYASIVGLVVSVVGFAYTLATVDKAKTAARAAESAARETGAKIRLLETIVDLTETITHLEEIKRLHREKTPAQVLLDRYAATRKLLVILKNSVILVSDEQKSVIQNVIVNLKAVEKRVETSLRTASAINVGAANTVISGDIDELLEVLTKLKVENTRGTR